VLGTIGEELALGVRTERELAAEHHAAELAAEAVARLARGRDAMAAGGEQGGSRSTCVFAGPSMPSIVMRQPRMGVDPPSRRARTLTRNPRQVTLARHDVPRAASARAWYFDPSCEATPT
jgi:hypothetical protein